VAVYRRTVSYGGGETLGGRSATSEVSEAARETCRDGIEPASETVAASIETEKELEVTFPIQTKG
jgi:hypothetical protein